MNNSIPTLSDNIKYVRIKINDHLKKLYHGDQSFNLVVKYSLINDGKKYRPFLVWATGKAFKVPETICFNVGAALEMIHIYSLIHDDLPSIDNGLIRHNKPALHKEYGESLAILAGDALLTDAFAILSDSKLLDAELKVNVISKVANHLGSKGMVLGQALEMSTTVNNRLTVAEVKNIHYLKTAKFMELAVVLGGVLAKESSEILTNLALFGKNLGIAFQMLDDLEDFSQDSDLTNIGNFLPTSVIKDQIKELILLALNQLPSKYDFAILTDFAKSLLAKVEV